MRPHYNLYNSTVGHVVYPADRSWKEEVYCDLYEVMHRYAWRRTDRIFSSSAWDHYIFKYLKKSKMIIVEKYGCETSEEESDDKYENFEEIEFERVTLAFGGHNAKTKNHYPIWDRNVCKKCGYSFNPLDIDSDKKKYKIMLKN